MKNLVLSVCCLLSGSVSIAQPVISSLSPQKGNPFSTVTITGSSFNTTPANNIVYFGATKATVGASTGSSLTVSVPTGATYDMVSVNNAVTGLTGYSPYPFLPTFNNAAYIDSDVNFGSATSFSMLYANAVAIGDVDGDGKADVVVSNNNTTVSVFRNISTSGSFTASSFAPKVSFTTGHNPSFIAIKDIDGDGKPEIITANSSSNTVSVFFNTSSPGSITTASFAAKVDFTTGSYPAAIAIGDINGDGKPEMIVCNAGSGTVSIFPNTASSGSVTSGSFGTRVDVSAGSDPASVYLADIDGDSKKDLVVLNPSSDELAVLRNQYTSGAITSSSFAAPVSFGIPTIGADCLAVADLDGDGKLDVVVGTGADNNLFVLRNTATSGTINSSSFAPALFITVPYYMKNIAISDVNGDGKPDILCIESSGNGVNYVAAIRNVATPGALTLSSFAPAVDFNLDIDFSDGMTLAVGDIDGDSKPDLVITDMNDYDYGVSVLLGKPLPLAPTPHPVVSSVSPAVAIPGSTVTISGSNFNAVAASNTVYFGSVKGAVSSASSTSLSVSVPVGAAYQPVSVYNSSSALAGFARQPFVPTFGDCGALPSILNFDHGDSIGVIEPFSLITGDIDGDGKNDIILSYFDSYYDSSVIFVYRNTSSSGSLTSGSFASPVGIHISGYPYYMTLADMDGDGKLDIVFYNDNSISGAGYTNTLAMVRNTSVSGTIALGRQVDFYYFEGSTFPSMSVGDIDGDGKPDVVVTNFTGFSIFRNNATPGSLNSNSLSDPVAYYAGSDYAASSAITDIDGDGKPDIIVSYSSGGFKIFRNTSSIGPLKSSSVAAGIAFATGLNVSRFATGDMDGDGKPDILTVNSSTNNVSVFRNTATSGSITTSSLASGVNFATGTSPKNIQVADMDGGGKPDMVVSNNSGISILLNTATPGSITTSSFAAAANFSTGGPALAIADLDGDNKPDLAICDNGGLASNLMLIRNNRLCGTPVTGTFTVCAGGATTTLANVSTGGKWTSGNTSVATVGSSSGIVSGVVAGTAVISYAFPSGAYDTVSAYTATVTITVNPLPAPGTITGTPVVCAGGTTALGDTASGGAWSSSLLAYATVGSTGTVSGLTAGTSTISYTVTNGCGAIAASAVVTINPGPDGGTITGTATVCPGAATPLSDAVTGGTWSSGATSFATVGSTGVVTGVAAGTATISYTTTNSCGSAIVTDIVTVNPLPAAGSITGTVTVCPATTTLLSDAVTGGTWSSSDPGTATVGSTGMVAGVAAGTTIISYTVNNSCGTAFTTRMVTVNPLPLAGTITGTLTVCASFTTTLSDAVPLGTGSGTWSSSTTAIATAGPTGIISGIAAGMAVISYIVNNTCGTAYTTATVTVNPLPDAGTITGTGTVCPGATTTLTDAAAGGSWTSSGTSFATIGSTGIISGVAAGTASISYTVTNGCGTAIATMVVTVNPLPDAGTITGTALACAGSSSLLSDVSAGGTWSSGLTPVATVGSAGLVTGIIAGTAIISYTVTNSCGTAAAVEVFTVNPLPDAGTITGALTVCIGSVTTLADASAGGSWNSSITTTAAAGSTGDVSGIAAGTSTISYTVTNGCGTAVTTVNVTVNPLADAGAISGADSVCPGSTISLTDAIADGTWSSGSAGIATVGATGIVTGVAAGTATVSYSVTNVCNTAVATYIITVDPAPDAGTITGPDSVCVADTITLASPASGGTWSSSSLTTAVVGSAGLVIGISAGTVSIGYSVTNSCGTAHSVHNVYVRSHADCIAEVQPMAQTTEGLTLYPNPTAGAFTVQSGGEGALGLYTLEGKEIIKYVVARGSNSYTLPGGLAAGVYMCRFTGQDGSTTIVRLVYEP